MSDIRVAPRPVIVPPTEGASPAPVSTASVPASGDSVERKPSLGQVIKAAAFGAGGGLAAASLAGMAAVGVIKPEYAIQLLVVGTAATTVMGAVIAANDPTRGLVGAPGSTAESAARGGAIGALVGTGLFAGFIGAGLAIETDAMAKGILMAVGALGQPFVTAASAGIGAAVGFFRKLVS